MNFMAHMKAKQRKERTMRKGQDRTVKADANATRVLFSWRLPEGLWVFLACSAQYSAELDLDRLSCMCLMPLIDSPPDNNCVLFLSVSIFERVSEF